MGGKVEFGSIFSITCERDNAEKQMATILRLESWVHSIINNLKKK
jgi:hypothetical protein